MNLKFCLFSFCFLFQFCLNEGNVFEEIINSIGVEGLKEYLFENLAGKLRNFEHKIDSSNLGNGINELCNKLGKMVVKNDWDNLKKRNKQNKLSQILTNGKEILENFPEPCFYEKRYYTNASQVIVNNWEIFSKIFNFWKQKINFSISQYDSNPRFKRGNNHYYYNNNNKEEDERQRKHNEKTSTPVFR
uniref:Uncharacterized protein n=1 Tax=Meloidogyne enterolobii TaxID=390850 RepID=A0A6V7UCZ3_MELEN|nr:unnamed protein product [Meloidogyne enterolobii]